MKDVTDKKFWKPIKPFFSKNVWTLIKQGVYDNSLTKIIVRENDVLISDEKALATLINRYFVNIIAGLNLKRDSETHSDTPVSQDDILKRFDCHQSILKIQVFKTADKFSFHKVTEDEVGR